MFATSCIAGNLTADPELKHVGANNIALAKFTIAVNDRSSGEEKVYFFAMQAWGGRAETIAEHFAKGDRIAVTCDMRQDRWEDKSTGQNRSRDVHNVNGFMFPGKGKKERTGSQTKNFSKKHGKKDKTVTGRHADGTPMTTRELAKELPLQYADDDDIPF